MVFATVFEGGEVLQLMLRRGGYGRLVWRRRGEDMGGDDVSGR